MATPAATRATARPTRAHAAPWVGLGLALALVAAALLVPPLTGWDVHARLSGDAALPPLHGFWDPGVGPGTLPAVVLAVLGTAYAARLADALPWRALLLVSYATSLAWLLSLAYVDGSSGISRVLGNDDEYLQTARSVSDVPAVLHEFISRIPYAAAPENWPTHVAGHPAGALLVFVGLDRVGLGGDYAAGLVVTLVAASTCVAVLVTLRALGAGDPARVAAPYLVLTPAAVFMAVSADALFGAVAAWGLAALAVSATCGRGTGRVGWNRWVGWAALAGLLLGWTVLMSYGLLLLAPLALAVLAAARSWRPLPVAAATALVPVLVLAGLGFSLWEAYPVLSDRYWDGIAADRPASYWLWGDLAALLICAGPLLGAALAALATPATPATQARQRRRGAAVVAWLVAAAVLAIVVADASRMSKAEVERIWLPFVPWLTLAAVALPQRWRRPGLALQVGTALVVQHLLYTSW